MIEEDKVFPKRNLNNRNGDKMALLIPEDLININKQLQEADSSVVRVTGLDISGIGGALYGTSPCHEKVGIVPITSGNGIIGNFSASLHAITKYFGFESFVTDMPDVSGYYEAVENKVSYFCVLKQG